MGKPNDLSSKLTAKNSNNQRKSKLNQSQNLGAKHTTTTSGQTSGRVSSSKKKSESDSKTMNLLNLSVSSSSPNSDSTHQAKKLKTNITKPNYQENQNIDNLNDETFNYADGRR